MATGEFAVAPGSSSRFCVFSSPIKRLSIHYHAFYILLHFVFNLQTLIYSLEPSRDQPAQCSVPNITFSTESSNTSSLSGGPTTPNTPVLLLARHREPQSSGVNPTQSQRNTGDMVPVSVLQRPSSAPTSLESSSPPGSSAAPPATGNQSEPAPVDVDSSIVEALKSSKDRLYVLKLGETMEHLISQGVLYAKVDLQPASSYQRLLVHRCAAFYHLTQESSPNTVAVIVTADSRM